MALLHRLALQAIEDAYGTIKTNAYVLKGVDADVVAIADALTNHNFHTAQKFFLMEVLRWTSRQG